LKIGLALKENAKKRFDIDNNMRLPSQFTGAGACSLAKVFAEGTLRFFQFVMALTVTGLYGVDLNYASQTNIQADPKWIYAEVTAGLSAITIMVYLFALFIFKDCPLAHRTPYHLPFFVWECILCILWLTLFGIFGKIYISDDPTDDSGIVRMKNAVWVDLTNLLLWVITVTWYSVRCSVPSRRALLVAPMNPAEGTV
jgi:hypothetical protein